MERKRGWLGLSALVLGLTLSVAADAKMTRAGAAGVTFLAVGPGGLKIEGKSADLRLTEDGGTLVIAVPLAPLDTGIALRNRHMREKYLEVDKYPHAELRVARAALQFPAGDRASSGDATGRLTLHGQTRPVTFQYEARSSGAGYVAKGSLRVDMRDFGIEVPSYMGVKVKPHVVVNVTFGVADI